MHEDLPIKDNKLGAVCKTLNGKPAVQTERVCPGMELGTAAGLSRQGIFTMCEDTRAEQRDGCGEDSEQWRPTSKG